MIGIRIIFMGKDKPEVIDTLKFLVENNFEIVKVVGPSEKGPGQGGIKLNAVAEKLGIETISDDKLYEIIEDDQQSLGEIDVVISYLFWKKIKKPLIELPKLGCINFHPAPLPDFRGVAPYSFGILEKTTFWGVSAHFVDESFDTGDIIRIKKFDIEPDFETAFSLEQKSQKVMFELFKEVMIGLLDKGSFPRKTQMSKGHYFSKDYFEKTRKISSDDSLEEIKIKIRAFWYPPFDGATLSIKNKDFTLIDENILKEIAVNYHKKDNLKKFSDKKISNQ